MEEPLGAEERRRGLRRDLGPSGAGGLPATRALRAVRHRVPRHDRRRPRPSGSRTRSSANPVGRDASCRPSAPTTWSTPTGPASTPASPHSGELTGADTSSWAGYLDALRSRRAAFVGGGSDRIGPRAPLTGHGRSVASGRSRSVRAHRSRRGTAGRRRAVPRPDAGRNGSHEPGRRARAADPCRCVAGPQSDAWRPASARTRAPTSPQRADYVRRPQAAPRPVRQRARADGRRVHARRDHLQPRAGAPGRALPGAAPRTALVVLRQPRGHPALLPARSSRRPDSPTPSGSTTMPDPC